VAKFQIFNEAECQSLRRGGAILRACLEELPKHVRPGIKTKELDAIAEEFIRSHDGASPAFKGYHGFTGTLCTSVNEECVHAIPGERVLKEGDIVGLDCGVIFGGLYTDACVTVGVGRIPDETQRFLDVTKDALEKAVSLVAPQLRVGDISSVIQKTVEAGGFACVRALTGHGLGSTLHQFPDVPNVGKAGTGPALPAYTIIAIEPITSMGSDSIVDKDDGWTICTADGSLSAHFEHTVLVLDDGHEILA